MKIKALPYADDFGTQHFFNLITADLEGHKMNLYSSNVDNNHWMIVESTEPITYEEMDHRRQKVPVPFCPIFRGCAKLSHPLIFAV